MDPSSKNKTTKMPKDMERMRDEMADAATKEKGNLCVEKIVDKYSKHGFNKCFELMSAREQRLVDIAWSFDDYAKHNQSCLFRSDVCDCGLTEARKKFKQFLAEHQGSNGNEGE